MIKSQLALISSLIPFTTHQWLYQQYISKFSKSYRSFFGKAFVCFLVVIVLELSDEVYFFHLVKAFIGWWLLQVLEPWMNWYFACFAWKMFSLIVCYPLVIVMEADVLVWEEIETSHLIIVFLGQINEIFPIFSFGICIINYHTFSFLYETFSHFVTFFFCF